MSLNWKLLVDSSLLVVNRLSQLSLKTLSHLAHFIH